MTLISALIFPILFAVAFVVLVFVIPARRRRRRLREAGLYSELASGLSNAESMRESMARMSTQQLLWAQYLPHYGSRGRNLVREVLVGRGVSVAEMDNWLPAPQQLRVPAAFRRELSPGGYDGICRVRSWCMRAVRVSAATSLGTLIVWTTMGGMLNVPDGLLNASWSQELAFFHNPALALTFMLVGYSCESSFCVLILGALLGGVVLQRFSRRVLLLRPFGERRMTRSLKQAVARTIGHRALVITLADRNYRPSWILFAIAAIFGGIVNWLFNPLLHISPRACSVRSERSYRKLQRFLLRRLKPSFLALLAGGQAFNVRSKDQWWKPTILTLMHSADCIVIDLSRVKAGTDWELAQIKARGLGSKVVYIAVDHSLHTIEPALAPYFSGELPPVHVYDDRGRFRDPEALIAGLRAPAEATGAVRAHWGSAVAAAPAVRHPDTAAAAGSTAEDAATDERDDWRIVRQRMRRGAHDYRGGVLLLSLLAVMAIVAGYIGVRANNGLWLIGALVLLYFVYRCCADLAGNVVECPFCEALTPLRKMSRLSQKPRRCPTCHASIEAAGQAFSITRNR
jgi:hypothetical protein